KPAGPIKRPRWTVAIPPEAISSKTTYRSDAVKRPSVVGWSDTPLLESSTRKPAATHEAPRLRTDGRDTAYVTSRRGPGHDRGLADRGAEACRDAPPERVL